MESAAVLRAFHCITSPLKSITDKPGVVPMNNVSLSSFAKYHVQGVAYGGKLISSPNKVGGVIVSCVKTSATPETAKSDDLGKSNGAVMSDSSQKESGSNNSIQRATFPSGLEALVTEVCDNTEIAELKVKVGDFEMHLKRNIEPPKAPAPVESPTIAPPIPSKPMNESVPAPAPPAPPKPSAEKISPFTNVPAERSTKLAALEASGTSGYVLVASPTVGSFQRGRTLKGKKQPPIVKEKTAPEIPSLGREWLGDHSIFGILWLLGKRFVCGLVLYFIILYAAIPFEPGSVIKEGQTIGYVDQFGTELPVKSDVAGEVLKFLYNDGEAVGYGDPLIAVLPSFHDIK